MKCDLLFGGFAFNDTNQMIQTSKHIAHSVVSDSLSLVILFALKCAALQTLQPWRAMPKKDNKCTISNRHWSKSFIHSMILLCPCLLLNISPSHSDSIVQRSSALITRTSSHCAEFFDTFNRI